MAEPKVKKPAKTKTTKAAKDAKKKILVIVESPAKAKTINRYLGNRYQVEASMGHVIDLPKSRIAVDVDNGFKPDYITVRGRGKILNTLKRLAGKAEEVLLAADEDREGEAISFHLKNEITRKYPTLPVKRIIFHEITKKAIQDAILSQHDIDLPKVEAQKARRVLDRLVGYNISPILWEKVKKGLSAGRVQSVALRLVCEREAEIDRFIPREYWELDVELGTGKHVFGAQLARLDGKKADLPDRAAVDALLAQLAGGAWTCLSVDVKPRVRRPSPPFTTSKLQQDAANKLGFTSDKTMRIAQQLYEGVELPEGATGLISYMRTDSTRISDDALAQVRAWVAETYGAAAVPDEPNTYKNKKGSQDAHEAIRPTDVTRAPDAVKQYLSRDQNRLYKLVWSAFVASQMKPAVFEQTTFEIGNGPAIFRANGSRLLDKGFLRAYGEIEDDEKNRELPAAAAGEVFTLVGEPAPSQHFTQPPARFTDASIVKTLEESGIGRPSTYAPTISTLIKRYYATRQGRQLVPSELGKLINKILVAHFPTLVDMGFTAEMEEKLDQVEEQSLEWAALLAGFWRDFKPTLDAAAQNIENMKNIFDEPTPYVCELCGRPMTKKLGRFGYFLACSGFPECRSTQPLPLAACPRPGCGGHVVAKKGRRGRLFYGCTNYKADDTGCGFVSWDKPSAKPCPKCGGLLLERSTREKGLVLACADEACAHEESAEE